MTVFSVGTDAPKPDGQSRFDVSLRLDIPQAAEGLGLVMQSGVLLECTTGISLEAMLLGEFRLDAAQRKAIDVFFLNGMPVDNPAEAIVTTGSRLAIAAALPGLAGLAMRSGSAVAAMRAGITYRGEESDAIQPAQGYITLTLFSLALPLLAPVFFRRGVLVQARKLVPYMRPALVQTVQVDGQEQDFTQCAALLAALPEAALVRLTATFLTQIKK